MFCTFFSNSINNIKNNRISVHSYFELDISCRKLEHFHQFINYVSMVKGTICKCYYIFGYESWFHHPDRIKTLVIFPLYMLTEDNRGRGKQCYLTAPI